MMEPEPSGIPPHAPLPDEPPRANWKRWVLVGCGGCLAVSLVLVIVGVALLFPVFAKARANGNRVSCVRNLETLGMAAMVYAEEYDETYAPAGTWNDTLRPYIIRSANTGRPRNDPFRCPEAPNSLHGYAYYGGLSGILTARVERPSETPMLYDSTANQPSAADMLVSFAPRHAGPSDGSKIGVVTFADGHVSTKAALPPNPPIAPPLERELSPIPPEGYRPGLP